MLVISMLRMVGTASPITSLGMGVWVILMYCACWAFVAVCAMVVCLRFACFLH